MRYLTIKIPKTPKDFFYSSSSSIEKKTTKTTKEEEEEDKEEEFEEIPPEAGGIREGANWIIRSGEEERNDGVFVESGEGEALCDREARLREGVGKRRTKNRRKVDAPRDDRVEDEDDQ